MNGKEVFLYVINKAREAVEVDNYRRSLADYKSCGMNSVFARGAAGFESLVYATMPCYRRVLKDPFKGHNRFFAVKSLGSGSLDCGVVGATVALVLTGNPVEAALLKGGYNLACSVVPDALNSVRNRFGANGHNLNLVK